MIEMLACERVASFDTEVATAIKHLAAPAKRLGDGEVDGARSRGARQRVERVTALQAPILGASPGPVRHPMYSRNAFPA